MRAFSPAQLWIVTSGAYSSDVAYTVEELANLSLRASTFVVVDLETTGASPQTGAGITEIGAVKVRGGEVLGEFKSFVNPLAPIPFFITELTGITNEMLRTAPVIDEALPDFLEFCKPHDQVILVAHNAPFDIGFLKAASVVIDLAWPNFEVIDTVRLARSVLSRDDVINCKLGTLAEFFGTTVTPTHRALDDAQTTVEILHQLFERVGSHGVETFGELQRHLAKKIKR
jgi:DNA polymerase III epsilon subunit family exonuclease